MKLIRKEKNWRKKIDLSDKQAILMINNFNPKDTNLEQIIIHELIHLKLWGMDQMIEKMINITFGEDDTDPKFKFAFHNSWRF